MAAVDLSGDELQHDLAVRLRRIEHSIQERDAVEKAVLTLSTADEPPLIPT